MAVVRRLRDTGHEAYLAGGCVRDMLLGQEPKDYDVATAAQPDAVRSLFSKTQAVGAAFGVILVRLGGSQVEVATFRRDGTYVDGRRPQSVRFSTAQEDAQRRDFTINGLFLDPLKPGALEDQILDFVGGRADLEARLIRAIGDPRERFEEDHLRLLRAVRFAARTGFAIETTTAEEIAGHAGQLARISPERVGEELRAMLTPATRGHAWALIGSLGLEDVLFRFLASKPPSTGLRGHFFSAVVPGSRIPFGLALAAAALQHQWRPGTDIRRLLERPAVIGLARALRQSLKTSNDESEQMQETMTGLVPLLADALPPVAMLKRFLARPTSPLSRQLLAAIAGPADAARVDWLQRQLAELERDEFAPVPLLTGDDLTEAGLSPGPLFRKLLDSAYDEQLEGRLASREEAMAYAMSRARE